MAPSRWRMLPPPPLRSPALHDDILCFAQQFRETKAERHEQAQALDRAQHALQEIHPGAKLHVFGSRSTSLCLPFGDTDLMIEALDEGGQLTDRKKASRTHMPACAWHAPSRDTF